MYQKKPLLYRRKKIAKKNKILHYTLPWIGVGCVALFTFGVISFAFIIRDLPSPNQLNTRQISESTKLFDRTGKTLLYEIHGDEKRTIIPFSEIPKLVKQATLAAEDANFYNEPAFNWVAILRALFTNIKTGRITQGGSTITQQLVKNVFLTSERTIIRKLKELVLSIELESRYTKDEILSAYLNQIPYGTNAYGVEAASQTYFNKSVRTLSLGEAATLASLLKAPSYYSPWGTHQNELMIRKKYVLDHMTELGFITPQEREVAEKEKLHFSAPSLGAIIAPHFSLSVKDYLINRYGENIVMNGGLRVITTLDLSLQKIAETAISEGVKRNEELYGSKNGALVAEDPKTGQILALVGSRNYFDKYIDGNFNVATQGLRQPGSALKPFVYMTAFQKGFSPKTILYDVPTEFDTRNNPETSYKPVNFDNAFRGPVAIESALAQSLNIPAVKTLYLAKFDDVLKNLHNFGITTLKERWRYGLSLTLGGGEIKLIDLVSAYATLAQNGIHHTQTFILKIEDRNGVVLEEYQDITKRVIDPQYPKLITKILTDSELRAPTFHLSLPLTEFENYEVALKTGTTEDYRDAWAFGYTPFLTVGVWAGNNDNTPMRHQGSSILAAIPMWNAFLKNTLPLFPSEVFEQPEPEPLPNIPMMNGDAEFVPIINGVRYPQIHSILYYIDRDNPLGPSPESPETDAQFINWEDGVISWARLNISNFSLYNKPIINREKILPSSQSSLQEITITPIQPKNGSFIITPTTFEADITSLNSSLSSIEITLNQKKILSNQISGNTYRVTLPFSNTLENQNTLIINVKNTAGKESSLNIVFFRTIP